ncbi:MAG: DUF3795 domain-containing protein [Candidatus Brockarchaeota archaeon]|nr:DUF3795 domain-containing protein [Candidatus Brockarchaeota archaeon]
MSKKDLLHLVAYCGLYCGLCAQRRRIPQQALQLQQTLHEEGFDDFFQYVPEMRETFPVFWQFLQSLAKMDCACRTGVGGPPDCKIRGCAIQKHVEVCPQCEQYPCKHIQALAEHYPTLIQDGKRLQKIGLEKWVEEQERRAKRGFTYADIRY